MPVTEQSEFPGGSGTVEHAHEAALHIRGPTTHDLSVTPHRAKLIPSLCRDDVEMPVEVDRPRVVADHTADDAWALELTARRQLNQLWR
jgi:hypothetical protein